MDEFDLIRRFFDRPDDPQDVRVGIGDDGAVLAPPVGTDIVNVVDTMVDGVHFPVGMDPADIGYRSVAVNLSDIAAMGASPRWMTLALTLQKVDTEWLDAFSRGLFEIADRFGVSLVGGDTTRGNDLVISVQLTGTVVPGGAITRSGANEGDLVFVTGSPGDAAAGLQLFKQKSDHDDAIPLIRHFCRPEPRVAFGEMILPLASAAIDVSDGLYADLQKLLVASSVGGRLDLSALPVSGEAVAMFGRERALDFSLGGGDDYELCFTAPAAMEQQVLELGDAIKLPVTRIGEVSGSGLRCMDGDSEVEYEHQGYRHFAGGDDA